jgi:hypothetical protein
MFIGILPSIKASLIELILPKMRNVFNCLFAIIAFLCLEVSPTYSQSKIILDKASTGGYCNQYFDLGDHGFALIFNKNKDVDEGVGKDAALLNNIYYYSKDLSKKAVFKVTTNGQFTMHATKNNIFIIDRLSTKYTVRVLDFTGRELLVKKFDLEDIGLNQDQIFRFHFTQMGKMMFEVYDGHDYLHLFQINLMSPEQNILSEIDIPVPSGAPLENLKFQGRWQLVGESGGYYVLAKKGANAEYDPNAIAYHLAFYDEDFQLFRELLLDNFVMPGTQMIGKDASFSLNPVLQSFIVSCLIIKNGKTGFMVANYGMDPNSNVMKLFWHKEFELINNEKYKLVENDGLSVPAPPVIAHKGPKVLVSVVKGRTNVQEEALNQMVVFNPQGNTVFNEVQMGNYEQLNLDGYCVDNNNMYSRIKKLQMNTALKPYCDMQNCDVLDIDLDANGNELAIVRNYDIKKNQVIIYRYTAK